jgi:hypothetical protein
MDENYWGIILAGFFELLAVALFGVAYWYGPKMPPLSELMFLAGTFISALVGGFIAIDWVSSRLIWWYRDVREALTITVQTTMLDKLSRMTDVQLEAAGSMIPRINLIGGAEGPAEWLVCDNLGEVPLEFVEAFFNSSSASYCNPIRNYTSGSTERLYADILTRYLISKGLASDAAGNRAARWTDRPAAEVWVGLRRMEEE